MSNVRSNLEPALSYARFGWQVFPCHFMSSGVCSCGRPCQSPAKHPMTPDGFKAATTDENTIGAWWGQAPEANIAVRTGKESGVWVLDLDGEEGIAANEELASRHGGIPETVSSRTGGGGIHSIFKWPADSEIRNRAKIGRKPIDVRGNGGYILLPPSNHISGNSYSWINAPGQTPLADAPAWLIEFVTGRQPASDKPETHDELFATMTRGLDLRTAPGVSEGQRHNRACQLIGAHLGRGDDASTVLQLALDWAMRCIPTMDPDEVAAIVTGLAEKEKAKRDPSWLQQAQALETINDPALLARLCLDKLWKHPDGWTIRLHRGFWYQWNGMAYCELPEDELTTLLYQPIKDHFDRHSIDSQNRHDPKPPKQVNRSLLSNVRLALQSKVIVQSDTPVPCWLDNKDRWPAHEVLACPGGLFHLPRLADSDFQSSSLTPTFFSTFALTYEIEKAAAPPDRWFAFLKQLWPKDQQCIDTLQEWFGYCLTPDTRQHKMLMLVGPTRTGKGTIARILTELLGQDHVAAPPLSSLQTDFGLQPLLDKTLAIIPDARLGKPSSLVVERLLSVSGEDFLTVNIKNKDPITVKLRSRLVLISNELPRLDDASGALVNRIIFLNLKESFLGKEQTDLTDQLAKELPGILLWAIAGWKRLRERGHFEQPESGKDMLEELEDLTSPIRTFVKERCDVSKPLARIERQKLYHAYLDWCKEKGINYPYAPNEFGRRLRAACSVIGDYQSNEQAKGQRVRYYEGISLNSDR